MGGGSGGVGGSGSRAEAISVSLRRRVLAYVALAAIASCALTTAVAVVLVRHKIADQRVTALETQANVLSVVGGAPGALTAGDHVYRVGSGKPRRVRPAIGRAVVGRDRDSRRLRGNHHGGRARAALRGPDHPTGTGGAHPQRSSGVRRVAAVPGQPRHRRAGRSRAGGGPVLPAGAAAAAPHRPARRRHPAPRRGRARRRGAGRGRGRAGGARALVQHHGLGAGACPGGTAQLPGVRQP